MLNPEKEEGNIEYKRLVSNDKKRIESLASQMNWRLIEGNGICYYYIGIEDDGSISKLNKQSLYNSLKNLKKVTNIINSKIQNVKILYYNSYEYLIVKIKKKFNSNFLYLF
jgi:elongation factor 1-alpha